MKKYESVLKPVGRIFGGANLPHCKNTAEMQSVRIPPPDTVCFPLKQHIGVVCEACVKVGDSVMVGTKIADSESPLSSPIYSSVSGTVKSIAPVMTASGDSVQAITVESDGNMQIDFRLKPPVIKNYKDVINAARNCGLVGLGGAGFPTHIKLSPAADENIDTLIVNGAECEPYVTSDYRECMENFDDIVEGVYLLKDLFGFKKVIIAIENNKPAAIKKLYDLASDCRDSDDTVKLMKLKTRYPQGAEKTLVYTTTKRIIPFGKLPADVGCVIMNITSISTLYRYIKTGIPLVEKRITVDGDGINEPKNVIVPIGTSLGYLLDFCGGVKENADKIIMGGPMMGSAVENTDIPITKPNNSVLVLENKPCAPTTPCIRCGRCVRACPIRLTPAAVETALRVNNIGMLKSQNVNYCIECGSCSFVCPAKRPLTQAMRTAKNIVRRNDLGK